MHRSIPTPTCPHPEASNSYHLKIPVFFLYSFCEPECVGAPLLMSPILYFWEMSLFEPRELTSVAIRRATNLATHLPCGCFFLVTTRLAGHCPLQLCPGNVYETYLKVNDVIDMLQGCNFCNQQAIYDLVSKKWRSKGNNKKNLCVLRYISL